jgi:hypothetical protein
VISAAFAKILPVKATIDITDFKNNFMLILTSYYNEFAVFDK